MTSEKTRKEEILRAAEYVKEKIFTLPLGSETSISKIVRDHYMSLGYEFIHGGTDTGYGFSDDGGKTFVLLDLDMFDVLDLVTKLLKGQRILDFSEYFNAVVGMPYNIPFIIRESDFRILVRVTVRQSRSPRHDVFFLLDRRKNNCIVEKSPLFFSDDGSDTVEETAYTVPYSEVQRIKELLKAPVLREREEEIPTDLAGDRITMDGINTSVDLKVGRDYRSFWYSEDDIETVRSHGDKLPQNNKVVEILDAVHDIKERYCTE
ncbi:MAG: hypothetical protein IKE27_10570 [Oscillospiraceae bacterium]|nr:hypothetical protein [Oscillospiraceae bacterium]